MPSAQNTKKNSTSKASSSKNTTSGTSAKVGKKNTTSDTSAKVGTKTSNSLPKDGETSHQPLTNIGSSSIIDESNEHCSPIMVTPTKRSHTKSTTITQSDDDKTSMVPSVQQNTQSSNGPGVVISYKVKPFWGETSQKLSVGLMEYQEFLKERLKTQEARPKSLQHLCTSIAFSNLNTESHLPSNEILSEVSKILSNYKVEVDVCDDPTIPLIATSGTDFTSSPFPTVPMKDDSTLSAYASSCEILLDEGEIDPLFQSLVPLQDGPTVQDELVQDTTSMIDKSLELASSNVTFDWSTVGSESEQQDSPSDLYVLATALSGSSSTSVHVWPLCLNWHLQPFTLTISAPTERKKRMPNKAKTSKVKPVVDAPETKKRKSTSERVSKKKKSSIISQPSTNSEQPSCSEHAEQKKNQRSKDLEFLGRGVTKVKISLPNNSVSNLKLTSQCWGYLHKDIRIGQFVTKELYDMGFEDLGCGFEIMEPGQQGWLQAELKGKELHISIKQHGFERACGLRKGKVVIGRFHFLSNNTWYHFSILFHVPKGKLHPGCIQVSNLCRGKGLSSSRRVDEKNRQVNQKDRKRIPPTIVANFKQPSATNFKVGNEKRRSKRCKREIGKPVDAALGLKTWKIKMHPTAAQAERLAEWIGCANFIYNATVRN